MLERVIQGRLCRAILGLSVGHDLDIEPATRSISSLPENVCLTCSDGLLIGYKVACQFESHPLRQAVRDFRVLCGKIENTGRSHIARFPAHAILLFCLQFRSPYVYRLDVETPVG